MLRPSLNDPAVFPDDAVLARRLGRGMAAWDAFMALLKNDYPLIAGEWRYYNDGKSWLFKVTQKKKTVCWVAVWDKYFTAAFYLNAKAEDLVRASFLDQPLKDSFLNPDKNNKFSAIRVEVRKKANLDAVRELIGIKLKMK